MMFFSFVLERAGYTVVSVISGENACEWLNTHRPLLVLCDIMLPGMNGVQVVQYMQTLEHLKDVPAIAITALAMHGDKEKFLASGFIEYIPKPTSPDELIETVKRVLEQ
jgi:CheY-like chemotaxis protein